MLLMVVAEADVPVTDSLAAANHVAQREISRESRHHQTGTYRSSRATCACHQVTSARTWLRLASVAAVIHHSTLTYMRGQ